VRRARRCFFLVAPAVCAGAAGPDTVAFGGQFRADAFAGFAKLMIYAASGAALVVAPASSVASGRCAPNTRCCCCSPRSA
jgi:hypothetical protein